MNFDCISPNESILLASFIAMELAGGKDSTQIAALGNFLMTIGQNLGSIASQMEVNELCDKGK